MSLKITVFAICLSVATAVYVNEIRVKTANCADCGMTFLGELSVKVKIENLARKFKFKFITRKA